MFGRLRNKTTDVAIATPVKPVPKAITLTMQIHAEVDAAQDRLLAEAQQILKDHYVTPEMISRVSRLQKLGFTQTLDVKQVSKHLEISHLTESQARIIERYKKVYPTYKFLTIPELHRICAKYKLVYAPVGSYTLSIPEENLKDLEQMQYLERQDIPADSYALTCEPIYRRDFRGLTESELDLLFTSGIIVYRDRGNVAELVGEALGKTVTCVWSPRGNFSKVITSGLFIAAPQSHFNLDNLTQIENGYLSVEKLKQEDPIVFRYIKGGIQVLTKWGEEASDPALKID